MALFSVTLSNQYWPSESYQQLKFRIFINSSWLTAVILKNLEVNRSALNLAKCRARCDADFLQYSLTTCCPHMPIGKVWIYRLLLFLFVCLSVCLSVCFCVCTVPDFFGDDKASGVKSWTMVLRRSGQGISHFEELCFPRSRKSDESARGEWT